MQVPNKYRKLRDPQKAAKAIIEIPDDVFRRTQDSMQENSLLRWLQTVIGNDEALATLKQYQVGSNDAMFPGAAVFWMIDPDGRKVGAQIAQYAPDGHTAKSIGIDGTSKRNTSWIHTALSSEDWAKKYIQAKANCWPYVFGLPLVQAAPMEKPVAIVEAPKTAILASHFIPAYTWCAIGALTWLAPHRMRCLTGRKVVLFPDKGKADFWTKAAGRFPFLKYCKVDRSLEEISWLENDGDLADVLTSHKGNVPYEEEKHATVAAVSQGGPFYSSPFPQFIRERALDVLGRFFGPVKDAVEDPDFRKLILDNVLAYMWKTTPLDDHRLQLVTDNQGRPKSNPTLSMRLVDTSAWPSHPQGIWLSKNRDSRKIDVYSARTENETIANLAGYCPLKN